MKIGLTPGDPAGIGLEVVLKALPRFLDRAEWFLFGDRADFRSALERYQPSLDWREGSLSDVDGPGLRLVAIEDSGRAVAPGHPSAESGRRARAALETAGRHVLTGDLEGLVTAPLSKRWVGSGFTGHTEFLRDQSGVTLVAMSFFTPRLKVALATTHLALRDALDALSTGLYRDLLALIDREFRSMGFPQPRIAVSGINPHAGESGMFGSEEIRILAPAVEAAVEDGLMVSGPWPADTCYQRAWSGEFDVVLAPYHDQGLIPVKLLAPGRAANVTLGLPYIRTSPDHGTAFDIAGRGVANPDGMASAMEWALELVVRRARSEPTT